VSALCIRSESVLKLQQSGAFLFPCHCGRRARSSCVVRRRGSQSCSKGSLRRATLLASTQLDSWCVSSSFAQQSACHATTFLVMRHLRMLCVYVCVCVCLRERERERERDIHTHTHTYTRARAHTHTHTCICICIHIHIQSYKLQVLSLSASLCVCVCVYAYVYIYNVSYILYILYNDNIIYYGSYPPEMTPLRGPPLLSFQRRLLVSQNV
jgi:hypothetical protein